MSPRAVATRLSAGRLRVWCATALLALASSLPSLALIGQWREVLRASSSRSDPVDAVERQMAPLVEAVRGRPTVGYFSPRIADGNAEAARRRFLTQYVVAPTIVVGESAEPVAVGDCLGVQRCYDVVLGAGYEVERDLGNGWLLLRRRVP